MRRAIPFFFGLFSGLLSAALVLLLSAEPRGHPIPLQPPPTAGPVTVHVTGAVRQPGVYQLDSGALVQAAVQAAGGALPAADLSRINLATRLSDGQQVVVPIESQSVGAEIGTPGISSDGGILSLNQATEPQLERLPGIGPSLAAAVVEYREANGPFQSVEDLLEVPGIGPAKLDAIRDLVSVP